MATNPGAITFYKKMGFEQEAHYKKEFWINDTWVDDFQFAYYL
jgi:RimJ/RimL family protein N-acetyltransferase